MTDHHRKLEIVQFSTFTVKPYGITMWSKLIILSDDKLNYNAQIIPESGIRKIVKKIFQCGHYRKEDLERLYKEVA